MFNCGRQPRNRKTQYDYHGTFVNGFLNSLFGQKDVTVTTEGYNYIAMDAALTRYIGWDLALTENGWVMVEGNRTAQFGWQITTQTGFREEVNGYLKEMGKKF